jgi:hypothetical protein
MKRMFAFPFVIGTLIASAAHGAVWINEVMPNAPGSDTGNEFFELRGTPNLPLTNYYLLSLEGQGTTGRGDINQYFDLGAFSLGANGYLFARQAGSKYTATATDATVIENSVATGWGRANDGGVGSSVGHYSDGSQVDLENAATTFLLVNIGAGILPTNTLDLDTNNDGFLDLPTGWVVADSVGIIDGADVLPTDFTYGAITFRAPNTNGLYLGACAYGNIINVPGPLTTSAGTFYVGRKGESTNSTANDWVGGIANGSAASPLNFYFYSASDPAYAGMLISDMVSGGTNASAAPLGSLTYKPTLHSSRFTNYTQIVVGGPVGDVAVDPRDNTTLFFTMDNDVGGAIYRAPKVASGNWAVDPTPVVTGLDRPSGLVVQSDGTLWWVHDVNKALVRLKAPWAANTPEMVITNFGNAVTDDDPIDLVFAPASFTGSLGHPNWLVIADRGSDADTYNALNLVDPATTELFQNNNNFLVSPTVGGLGFDDLTAIDSLPQSGEVVALTRDGVLSAVDGNGSVRNIYPTAIVPTASLGLATDPQSGRVWLTDDIVDEVWSVDVNPNNPTPDAKELSFPLTDPSKTYQQIKFHDPGMVFATNGAFLVLSDSSTAGGGGRLIVFHNEPFTVPTFALTIVGQTAEGLALKWASAGSVKYSVERATSIGNVGSFINIATNLTGTSFTDTNAPTAGAFYRVIAKP